LTWSQSSKNLFSRKTFQRLHAFFDLNQTWSKALAGQWLQKLSHGFDLKVDPGSQGSNKAKKLEKILKKSLSIQIT